MPSFFDSLKRAYREWKKDRAAYLAAAISYYALFSIAPFLLIALAIASFIYGQSSRTEILQLLNTFFGAELASSIQQLLAHASLSAQSGVAFIIGIILTLIGSIGLFEQLREAVAIIWKIPNRERTWRQEIQHYTGLFLVVFAGCGVLMSLLVISALVSRGSLFLSHLFDIESLRLLFIGNAILSFTIATGTFAILFKILPERNIPWSLVWVPALFTSFLFSIGKFVFGFYMSHSSLTSAYGAAGSLVALLFWIYYAVQLFLYGVELVKVHTTLTATRKTQP